MDATEVLARTIWGEARGDGAAGMAAVASVVLNRVAQPGWWGQGIASVCLKHDQFDCWNPHDPNRAKLLAVTDADPAFKEALSIAASAVAGTLPDSVKGATSYKTTALAWPAAWGPEVAPVAVVGHQSFYILAA